MCGIVENGGVVARSVRFIFFCNDSDRLSSTMPIVLSCHRVFWTLIIFGAGLFTAVCSSSSQTELSRVMCKPDFC